MMLDRDEQDIKRVFESIQTPEYDIASAVLQEKNSRCEIVPLRRIAVLAVSILVVVSVISVVALTNLSGGKWVEPGSSFLPLAGNDMQQAQSSEMESSWVEEESSESFMSEESIALEQQAPIEEDQTSEAAAEEQSQATENDTSLDPASEQVQKQVRELEEETQSNEVYTMYFKNDEHPQNPLEDSTFVDIRREELFYDFLENFRVPVSSLNIPQGYEFAFARANYSKEIDDLFADSLRISESEDLICYSYQLGEKEMRAACGFSADFETKDQQKIHIYVDMTPGYDSIAYETQDKEPIPGFVLTSIRGSSVSSEITANFYRELDPKIKEGWDREYAPRGARFLSITITSSGISRADVIRIAQGIG